MTLNILNRSDLRIPQAFLRSWVKTVQEELEPIQGPKAWPFELTLVFLNAREAQELNLSYRKKNYATDVLSFEGDGEESLGELVICPQVIVSQAKEHGLSLRQEYAYMVLHGILHLLGYDHETSEKDAKKMFALQDRIFGKLAP